MPPPNKRNKHARNFNQKTDGSFYKLKQNRNLPSSIPVPKMLWLVLRLTRDARGYSL
ncbi:hypothetical protein L914_18701 [Phytophthora nicotianae]|uniref:Uncharacterized protein n=1 Tax=Phytophthora nicotianae TaxID=4792 RepID=W2MF62_PHYNI|nr:hypothetical protein L914_18701 [Phytophthora nicotianae]